MRYYFLFIIFFIFSPSFIFAQVIINEINWAGSLESAGDEWIELYNNSDGQIDFNGWLLKAGDGTPEIFLKGQISPRNYFLLERTDDVSAPGAIADQLYKGALSNSGEKLTIYDNVLNVIDEVDCAKKWFAGKSKEKLSMQRTNPLGKSNDSANWQSSAKTGGTPKEKNTINLTANSVEIKKPEAEIKYPDKIIINEILPNPEGLDSKEEWIELYNQNNFEVDLSNWKISDKIGSPTAYTFVKQIIPANGYLAISRPQSKITLNNDKDEIELINPDKKVADSVSYATAPQGKSYNKTADGYKWSDTLTKETENKITIASTKKIATTKKQKTVEIKNETPQIKAEVKEKLILLNPDKIPINKLLTIPFALIFSVIFGLSAVLIKLNLKND